MIAGLDPNGRLLIPFTLWLDSIVIKAVCETNIKFRYSLSRFVLFPVDSVSIVSELDGDQLEESALNLRINF